MANYSFAEGWGAGSFPELSYFKAMAALELTHDKAAAEKVFEKLIADSKSQVAPVKDSRHITVNVDESHSARTSLIQNEIYRKSLKVSLYYLQGLGYAGLNEKEKARSFFEKALELDPMHIDSKLMLKTIQ
jgi:tetratricopeptide (TPR) repeat protein